MPSDVRPPEGAIRRIHLAIAILFILLLAVFVFRYRSEGATFGPYSTRYLVGLIAPFLALSTLLLLAGRARTRRRVSAPIAGAVAAAALLAGWVWAFTVSDEYVSIGMMLLVPATLLSIWSCARGAVEPLMAGSIVMLAGMGLFLPELPGLVSRDPLVVWGDNTTFATLFPRQPPFMGEGGRLRPSLDVLMRAPEYPRGARLVTESNGFRNTGPIPRVPADGEYRILSLGDSFSTGYCADQDAFFGSLLQKELSTRLTPKRRVRVLNAEVSDPAYGLWYLQNHGMDWHPSLVIYGLSGNDAMQAEQFFGDGRLFRLEGGRLVPNPGFDPALPAAWDRFEQFAYPAPGAPPAGWRGATAASFARKLARFRIFDRLGRALTTGRQTPVDMPGYASSWERLDGRKRLVDGSSDIGFFYRPGGPPIEAMHTALFGLLDAMAATARDGGARFLLVIHPQRYQVQPRDWDAIARRWNLDPADFDLRLEDRRLAAFCTARGLDCCDPVEAFAAAARENGVGLYLPGGDMHYDRLGHQIAAAAAASCVERLTAAAQRP